ncbi:hypothetical protein [Leyella stercorea]|uniref:hypothetical protein n=1 Tax=Leyella stercorea TaxID=363265 RepID=UPI00242D2638|nr:hypothetical protein [Leyella stercorea]
MLVICCVCSIRIDRRRHPHRLTQTSASTGADIRIDRRRHPHRPTQTSASTGADVRIDRRGLHKYEKKTEQGGCTPARSLCIVYQK